MPGKSVTHRFGGDPVWDLTISVNKDEIAYSLVIAKATYTQTITRAEFTGEMSPLDRPGCMMMETLDSVEVTYSGMNTETGKRERGRQFHVRLTRVR